MPKQIPPIDSIIVQALKTLPKSLVAEVSEFWADYCLAADAQGVVVVMDAAQAVELCRVWACSEFVARSCCRHPAMLQDLISGTGLTSAYGEGAMRAQVDLALEGVENEEELSRQLRHCRRREMVRIAWRDLIGRAALDETMADVSALADACIDAALMLLQAWHRHELGTPMGRDSGEPQALVVLGMGKLGAFELNYSSDVDLIFAFPEPGETTGGRRRVANEQFFIGLGQRLIKALDANTVDGFVFRVDMRLRPNGDSGPLALNFDAMEGYYQSQGRDWERYAMIKARTVAGDAVAGQQLLDSLRPFVYRRYLDYGTFESLRDMKAMINREVQRKGMQRNIKLGFGGIREIEFIGQLFQLIRGGREPALRQRGIQPTLQALMAAGHLPEFVGTELLKDYVLLRRVENRLQAWADEQTHDLPDEDDKLAWLRLALSLSQPLENIDGQALQQQLGQLRLRVHGHFEQVFAAPQIEEGDDAQRGKDSAPAGVDWSLVWVGDDDEALLGFGDEAEVRRRLAMLRRGHACRALSAKGRRRLDRLMPLLLAAIVEISAADASGSSQPSLEGITINSAVADQTLQRLLQLVEAIMRRTAYLALLTEYPLALSQLVKLCAASPWISEQLTRQPILLDELLDPRTLYAPPGRASLVRQLQAQLDAVADDDLEQQMDLLRHFKQTQVLRVAAADLVGAISLMVVSDHLTTIAEVILAQALNIAVFHVVPEVERGAVLDGFAVVAYGKMGGLELGYGSDLDLVFLHDGDTERVLRYTRLAQRIVHILMARTPAGILYEVDMRLRPSGASGLLVSSMAAFGDYQRSKAWTWEHQALIRGRMVVGTAVMRASFQALRDEVLARSRDPDELCREVKDMRERMRMALVQGDEGQFDVKQGRGGIVDIEFLVQYAVLRWAGSYPGLLQWTDNIRQLQTLAVVGLLTDLHSRLLIDAYQAYRACSHRHALQQQPPLVPNEEFSEYRSAVTGVWAEMLGENST